MSGCHRRLCLRALHAVLAAGLALNLVVILGWPALKGSAAGAELARAYSLLCHQLPSRCLHLGGCAMPVCARCLGVWAGLALGAAAAALGAQRTWAWRRRVAWTLVGLLAIDWLAGALGLAPAAWHFERTVAGLAGGFGAYVLLSRGLPAALAWCRRRVEDVGRCLDRWLWGIVHCRYRVRHETARRSAR